MDSLTLAVYPYRLLLMEGPLDDTVYPQRVDECKFLLIG